CFHVDNAPRVRVRQHHCPIAERISDLDWIPWKRAPVRILNGTRRNKVRRAAVIALLYFASEVIDVNEVHRRAGLRQVGDATTVQCIQAYFNYAIIECEK